MLPKALESVPNPTFAAQLNNIKEAADDFLLDNVYTDVKREDNSLLPTRKPKTVSRRTQTYLRELLQFDGEEA